MKCQAILRTPSRALRHCPSLGTSLFNGRHYCPTHLVEIQLREQRRLESAREQLERIARQT